MRPRLGIAALGLAAAPVLAAAQVPEPPPVRYPALPRAAAAAEGFVPAGWSIIARRRGDLNGDGAADLVLLLRMNDPANVLAVPVGDRTEPFDTNPHLLAIAFAERRGGMRLAASSHGLFPRPTRPWTGEEPPGEETITIERGSLLVSFTYLRGWARYRFRWRGGAFRLIGYDNGGASGGCITTLSINYLTGRARLTAVPVESDRVRSAWRRVRNADPPTLERLDLETFIPQDTITGPPLLCPVPVDD